MESTCRNGATEINRYHFKSIVYHITDVFWTDSALTGIEGSTVNLKIYKEGNVGSTYDQLGKC